MFSELKQQVSKSFDDLSKQSLFYAGIDRSDS